jgi:sec-independent protein translocase protein TatA
MEILGVGMPELIFIFLIAIIVMGPKDMQKAGKSIGKWLRNIVMSDGWKIFQQTSRELRTLPNKLMREASIEMDEINKIGKDLRNPLNTLDMKYPAPANSQPISTAPASVEHPAPDAESQAHESDQQQDA